MLEDRTDRVRDAPAICRFHDGGAGIVLGIIGLIVGGTISVRSRISPSLAAH